MQRREERSGRGEMVLFFSRNRYLNNGVLRFIKEGPCVHKCMATFLLSKHSPVQQSFQQFLYSPVLFYWGLKEETILPQCKMCPSPAKNTPCLIIKYWMLRLDWVFWHSYYLVLQPTVLYIGYQITHRNNFDIQQFCGLQNTVEPTFSYLNAVCREWPTDILTESIIICEIQREKIILCVCEFKSVFLVNIWLICGSFISCKAGRDVYCTSSKQEKLAEFYLGILS